MGLIGTLTTFTAGTTARASEVNANFDEIKTKVNTFALLSDVARTITAVHTYSATPVFNAGITVTGASTITGALTGITGLTVASGGASITGNSTITGTLSGLTGLDVTGDSTVTGILTLTAAASFQSGFALTGGQASVKRVDDGDSGAAKTLDFATGQIRKLRLTANCTLTLSNPVVGTTYVIELLQDATGSRTVTWPGTVKFDGGTVPTLTTTPNRKDVATLVWNGAAYLAIFYGFNFADTT